MSMRADSYFFPPLYPGCIPRYQGCDTPGSGGVPNPAIPYSGSQPGKIAAGASKSVTVNNQWNGRIFNQNGNCGSKGEKCTVLEYNLGKFVVQGIGIRTLRFVSSQFALIWSAPCWFAYARDMDGIRPLCGARSVLRGCFPLDPSLLIYPPHSRYWESVHGSGVRHFKRPGVHPIRLDWSGWV